MLVNGKHYRSIWIDNKKQSLKVINQNLLPYQFKILELKTVDDVIKAIREMIIRGAPLIGITGAFGVYFALLEASKKFKKEKKINEYVKKKSLEIINTRPTAINLKWAVNLVKDIAVNEEVLNKKTSIVFNKILNLYNDDIKVCKQIGNFGYNLLKKIGKKKNVINVLTHCNAGWLATVDYGTALAPIYIGKERGLKIHVWVEETRPRNQGSKLTAWELENNNIDYTIITDNAGGYVMQKGLVDIVLVGSDRTSACGDVCNKIGTYKTALAAYDNKIPFYVALPLSSFDLKIEDALNEIPIEERSLDEIKYFEFISKTKKQKVLTSLNTNKIKNFGFDITPSKYIAGLITEKGIIKPNRKNILRLFKDKKCN